MTNNHNAREEGGVFDALKESQSEVYEWLTKSWTEEQTAELRHLTEMMITGEVSIRITPPDKIKAGDCLGELDIATVGLLSEEDFKKFHEHIHKDG